jgi:carbon monoxide dehydrogenase subunit G
VIAIAAAQREVHAPPAEVFAFLADLETHWQLADRFIEVVSLERPSAGGPAYGGVVRMRGPLGLARTARTRVVEAHPPGRLAGTAAVGRATLARVSWTLTQHGDGTRVRLDASIEHTSSLDRLMLAAGGRRWLGRRFESILDTLACRFGAEAQAPVA